VIDVNLKRVRWPRGCVNDTPPGDGTKYCMMVLGQVVEPRPLGLRVPRPLRSLTAKSADDSGHLWTTMDCWRSLLNWCERSWTFVGAGPAVFKTVCGALLRRPGWVRFPSIPANFCGPDGQDESHSSRRLLCYRSWEPGLNPNVTKIRRDRKAYFDNILKSGHGSILEHAHTPLCSTVSQGSSLTNSFVIGQV
jgi:hypothetical protein